MKADSCKFHDNFIKRNLTHQCYAAYVVDQEDQSPFGLRLSNVYTADAYVFLNANITSKFFSFLSVGIIRLLVLPEHRIIEVWCLNMEVVVMCNYSPESMSEKEFEKQNMLFDLVPREQWMYWKN